MRFDRAGTGDGMLGAWWRFGLDLTMLGIESQGVIAQRMMKLSRGGTAAEAEALRMVEEKVTAAWETAVHTASGASPDAIVRDYRRRVRANARRLSAGG